MKYDLAKLMKEKLEANKGIFKFANDNNTIIKILSLLFIGEVFSEDHIQGYEIAKSLGISKGELFAEYFFYIKMGFNRDELSYDIDFDDADIYVISAKYKDFHIDARLYIYKRESNYVREKDKSGNVTFIDKPKYILNPRMKIQVWANVLEGYQYDYSSSNTVYEGFFQKTNSKSDSTVRQFLAKKGIEARLGRSESVDEFSEILINIEYKDKTESSADFDPGGSNWGWKDASLTLKQLLDL